MTAEKRGSVAEVFGVAFRLGLTSFGGPAAHIATFRDAYVDRLRWVDERAFAELVAVTSLLPGPSSSQLGIAIGALRAGKVGGVAAWLGFTLPSAVVMTALGLGLASSDAAGAGWLHGLELAAVAIVLTAVLAMRRALAQDIPLLGIAAFAATVAIVLGGVAGQLLPILGAALAGTWLFSRRVEPLALAIRFPVG
ncbi:MAG: chromate transporter, partial [Gaiella sp.]